MASTDFHFYTMNRADLVYAICHLLGLRPGQNGALCRKGREERAMIDEQRRVPLKTKRRCAVSRPSAFWCSTAPWAR